MDLTNLINQLGLSADADIKTIESKVKATFDRIKALETEKAALENKISKIEAKVKADYEAAKSALEGIVTHPIKHHLF